MIGMIARTGLSTATQAGNQEPSHSAKPTRAPGTYEDAMIVYGPHPYVVVIVVRGVQSAETRAELAAQIEHALAASLNPTI